MRIYYWVYCEGAHMSPCLPHTECQASRVPHLRREGSSGPRVMMVGTSWGHLPASWTANAGVEDDERMDLISKVSTLRTLQVMSCHVTRRVRRLSIMAILVPNVNFNIRFSCLNMSLSWKPPPSILFEFSLYEICCWFPTIRSRIFSPDCLLEMTGTAQ